MRLSTRLLSNAATNYIRLGTTFVLGLFTTWYILGAAGVTGLGLIALATSSTGLSHALERTFRFGLVRELAAAIASGERQALRRNLASALRLCVRALLPLLAFVLALAILAALGFFNTPEDQPELQLALVLLILCEGIHAAVRLLAAPYTQSLFASQQIALDNSLQVFARLTYAASAVIVFGWLLAGQPLATQLAGFAASRCSLQLADVGLGAWLARRRFPDLRLDRSAFDEAEYRSVRSTVWHSSQVALLLNLNAQFMAVLINLFFGLTYNALWQIVVQFSGFARQLCEGLLRGIAPLATHLRESGREASASDLMTRSIRYQFSVALPATALLGLWAQPLLELWVGKRLAADEHLAAAGVPVAEALALSASMAVIMLVFQAMRSGFLGVEGVLYGLGEVSSYAWASKWATLISLATGAALMAWLGTPLAAPIALLLGQTLYSPIAVLRAAHLRTGLDVGAALRRSLPRPLIAGALFVLMLLPVRARFESLSVLGLAVLLTAAGLVYSVLALLVIPEPDERRRLGQLLRRGAGWIVRRGDQAPVDPD